ncbi:MAG: hypothetical protein ACK56I_36690, partial [bacterium]
SFHGIDTPAKKAGSVTHVSGTERHLCLGPFKGVAEMPPLFLRDPDCSRRPDHKCRSRPDPGRRVTLGRALPLSTRRTLRNQRRQTSPLGCLNEARGPHAEALACPVPG